MVLPYTLGRARLSSMIYEREKRLLSLLDALGGSVGGQDFQKLLFLFCQEAEDAPAYAFVPYRFGAFSFTSYSDKRRLVQLGLLDDSDRMWRLTANGRATARRIGTSTKDLSTFRARYAKLRGDALVAETYRRYPYYATRSEILDRLSLEKQALQCIEAACPEPSKPGLVTIGYEGRSLEEYLNDLFRAGVTLLCDVRRNPLSRKYGFSKNTLANACNGMDLRYEHLPELGIDSRDRRGLETQEDYDALFVLYEQDYLPRQEVTLGVILEWIAKGERVALTCYERRPEQCHRHCVAEALEHAAEGALRAVHL